MSVIENNLEELKSLCDRHHVEKLYLFGSAVNADFSEDSDYDFLVQFRPIELSDYFSNYMSFKQELGDLLGRKIDLVEEQTLKNPILIRSINRSKELIYG